MKILKALFSLIGRVFLSIPFIISFSGMLSNFQGTVEYAKSFGVNIFVEFLVVCCIILEIIGVLSLLSGYKIEIGSICLLIFLVPVTFIFHRFWELTGQEAMMQMGQFISNTSLTGGLLFVIGMGAGPLSINYFLKKRN